MAMSSATLKAAMKARMLALFNDMRTTEYTETQYADAMAGIIAEETVLHIQTNAAITGTATAVQAGLGTAPVAGTIA